MSCLSFSVRLLRQRPEWDLAYLYGRRLDKLPVLIERKLARAGAFWRRLAFWLGVFRAFSLRQEPLKKGDVLFFAGSKNELSALDASFFSFKKNGVRVVGLVKDKNWLGDFGCKDWHQVSFVFNDFLAGAALGVVRARALRRAFYNDVPKGGVAREKYFDKFLRAHVLLPYFFRVLNIVRPRIVMMSNDHNVENRCLLFAAQALGIKTAYMQHASVSEIFPPLEFDYAFLDGRAALEIYRRCQNASRASGGVNIYLSGQKKRIAMADKDNHSFRVGVAVNNTDIPLKVAELIDCFLSKGAAVIVRLHPNQRRDFHEILASKYSSHANVEIIRAEDEELNKFFGRCNIIVAGASSILLEAALAGVAPYCENMGSADMFDYYGYLRNGLARRLPNDFDEMDGKELYKMTKIPEESVHAIRYYSETYGTSWQGREGELVALTVSRLLNGESVSDIYRKNPGADVFSEVCELINYS